MVREFGDAKFLEAEPDVVASLNRPDVESLGSSGSVFGERPVSGVPRHHAAVPLATMRCDDTPPALF